MRILILLLHALTSQYGTLEGTWELTAYDAINKVKSSPQYMLGEPTEKQKIDDMFEKMLSEAKYRFEENYLYYSDLEGMQLIERTAVWTLKGQVLTIDETDRPFVREAFIHLLSQDSLVMSPIIDGKIADSEMIFLRKHQ